MLNTDKNLYASLFDFVDPWKIDIIDYLNDNYMYDLSMEEIAKLYGPQSGDIQTRFAKVSELTPQKWIIKRRLEAAHELIKSGKKRVTEACFDVGFKNLSHFSKVYKETIRLCAQHDLSWKKIGMNFTTKLFEPLAAKWLRGFLFTFASEY